MDKQHEFGLNNKFTNGAPYKNTSLNEVDKFQYLKSLLEGSAAETISGQNISRS